MKYLIRDDETNMAVGCTVRFLWMRGLGHIQKWNIKKFLPPFPMPVVLFRIWLFNKVVIYALNAWRPCGCPVARCRRNPSVAGRDLKRVFTPSSSNNMFTTWVGQSWSGMLPSAALKSPPARKYWSPGSKARPEWLHRGNINTAPVVIRELWMRTRLRN